MVQKETLQLRVTRLWLKEDYTIGRLYVNGELWCNTLEDKVRDLTKEKKVPGKTAIPYGVYDIQMTYSNKFKKRLPLLLDVPFFTGIRIHAGNTPEDTEGCILLGENKEKGKVINSRHWVDKLISLIEANGGKAQIVIV